MVVKPNTKLTQILQMDSDLVHASGERSADDDAGAVAVVQSLELRAALLAVRTDLAHADLVAHHLHRLGAFHDAPGIRQKLHYKVPVGFFLPRVLPQFFLHLALYRANTVTLNKFRTTAFGLVVIR